MSIKEQIKTLNAKRDELICSDFPINEILEGLTYYDNQIFKLKNENQAGNRTRNKNT